MDDLLYETTVFRIIGTGTFTSNEAVAGIPANFSLSQNYPNPFNPSTFITFEVAESSNIQLQVFDVTGRLLETLIDEYRQAGTHNQTWDATNHASGLYFLVLNTKKGDLPRKCF